MNIRYLKRLQVERRHPLAAHWFSADTLRFFNSRIGAIHNPDHRPKDPIWFTSSERDCGTGFDHKPYDHGRRYTLRVLMPSGDVRTVGELYKYRTAAPCARLAKLAIAHWRKTGEIVTGDKAAEALGLGAQATGGRA